MTDLEPVAANIRLRSVADFYIGGKVVSSDGESIGIS